MEDVAVTPAPGCRLSLRQKAAIAVVLVFGAALRFVDIPGTVIHHSFRSDAAIYYKTAYNLRTYGVYSRADTISGGAVTAPPPDAFVTPGYPLFLALFVHQPPSPSVFRKVALWQALIGSLTLLVVFWLFWQMAGYGIGISAMLLTAFSPHQINTVLFMVTETWFTLLLMAALAAVVWHLRGGRHHLPALLAAGMLFGAAALTRPVLVLFPLALVGVLVVTHPRRQAVKGSAVLVAGFLLLWAPWVVRNEVSLGRSGDPSVMVNTLTAGMYPDFEYEHNPASLARPYRWDPRSAEINQDIGSALKEIRRRFRERPGEELEWYLVGKPQMLWSWDLIEGGWDAYIYPVESGNAYDTDPMFIATHAIAHLLHWPLVLLAFGVSIYSWLPRAKRRLQGPTLVMARVMGLLLLYNTGVLMVLAPFVRYSIPFLPLVFGLGSLGALQLWQWLRQRRRQALAPAQ